MPIEERDISTKAQFAERAQTVITTPPVTGVAYRNTAITPEEIANGQAYSTIADSAFWNQMFYVWSGLLRQMEQCGILPYSPLTNYEQFGLCMGTNGVVYKALQANGPDNGGVQPTTNTDYWDQAFYDLRGDLNNHIADTGAHGSVSAATANRIIRRDAMGRAKVAAPAAADDIAIKSNVDAIAENELTVTAPLTGGGLLNNNIRVGIRSDSEATANTVILRDANGRAKIAAPVADADIARKKDVDDAAEGAGQGDVPSSRTINTTFPLQGGGDLSQDRTISVLAASSPATNSLILRDANGRAKGVTPVDNNDFAIKSYVDAAAAAIDDFVPTSRIIAAAPPILGGGDLTQDRTYEIREATEALTGSVLKATNAEVTNRTSATKFITPTQLGQLLATTTQVGLIRLATASEGNGTSDTVAMTPAALAARTATTTRYGVVRAATAAEIMSGSGGANVFIGVGNSEYLPSRYTGWVGNISASGALSQAANINDIEVNVSTATITLNLVGSFSANTGGGPVLACVSTGNRVFPELQSWSSTDGTSTTVTYRLLTTALSSNSYTMVQHYIAVFGGSLGINIA